MKLVSVNTGLPREVSWHPPSSELRRAGGRMVTTAIFKEPAGGRVALRKINLDGDRQADLTVHGGEHKAVYCYSLAHYDYWKREMTGRGREERFLSAQADAFPTGSESSRQDRDRSIAGAKAEEKVGLLRSVP